MTQIPPAPEGTFLGNPGHLEQFLRLARFVRRSDEYEAALVEWQKYNREQQDLVPSKRKRVKGRGRKRRVDFVVPVEANGIDLRGGTFTNVCLDDADLRGVQFDHATFTTTEGRNYCSMNGAKLASAGLKRASLVGMHLVNADLKGADLSGANLTHADLSGANLTGATLRAARLTGANLQGANLTRTDVAGCRLDGCRVYGVAAWDLRGRPKILVI